MVLQIPQVFGKVEQTNIFFITDWFTTEELLELNTNFFGGNCQFPYPGLCYVPETEGSSAPDARVSSMDRVRTAVVATEQVRAFGSQNSIRTCDECRETVTVTVMFTELPTVSIQPRAYVANCGADSIIQQSGGKDYHGAALSRNSVPSSKCLFARKGMMNSRFNPSRRLADPPSV